MGLRSSSSAKRPSANRLIDAPLLSDYRLMWQRAKSSPASSVWLPTKALADLDPAQANSARLLLLVAIWNDIGFASSPAVKDLLSRFDARARSRLSVSDYICFRMAQGMATMADESMDTAIAHFDFVLSLPEELNDRFLLAIAHYWKGRRLRRRGDYDEALICTGRGRDLAFELGAPRMAAVMQVLEELASVSGWKMERSAASFRSGRKRTAPH